MKHLFIDDSFVETYEGTELDINPPMKLGPITDAGQDNVYARGVYGTIIQQGSIAEMWTGYHPGRNEGMVQYSFSVDGKTWINPELNNFRDVRKTPNNIVLLASSDGAVFFDPHDMRFPYKYLYFTRDETTEEGLYLIRSPNGKDWIQPSEKLQHIERAAQCVCFWDERIDKYVAYMRGWKHPTMTQDREQTRLRVVERWEFDSFDKLKQKPDGTGELEHAISGGKTVLETDEYDMPDTDIYTSGITQYEPDVYLAFPGLYRHFQIGTGYDFRELPNEGIVEIQMATSRDGIKWTRFRKPYCPIGVYGEHDVAQMYMHVGMMEFPTYYLQYYSGTDRTYRQSPVFSRRKETYFMTYILQQRKDGFVGFFNYDSMKVARLRTKEFEFNGYIALNFDAGASGYVRCSLYKNGEMLGKQKVMFVGNWIEKRVEFDNPDIRNYRGDQVSLEIEFMNAKVFGFTY